MRYSVSPNALCEKSVFVYWGHSLDHTRQFMLIMWFMVGALGHTILAWTVEGLGTKAIIWGFSYNQDPVKTLNTKARVSISIGNNLWELSHIIAGRSYYCPWLHWERTTTNFMLTTLLDSAPHASSLCQF